MTRQLQLAVQSYSAGWCLDWKRADDPCCRGIDKYVTWVSRSNACLPVTARLSGVNVASAAVTERGRRRFDWRPRHVVVMVEGCNDNIAALAVVTLVVARSVMKQREGDKVMMMMLLFREYIPCDDHSTN